MYYRPVQDNRWFRPDKRYKDIDWSNFGVVVREFRGRIQAWYLKPAAILGKIPHAGFAEAALTCLLIDTLSQYRFGLPESSSSRFKEFVRTELDLPESLPHNIRRDTGLRGPEVLKDLAEVLYHGFRCGILHEAHIPLFGAINGQERLVEFDPDGFTTHANGEPCLTVIIDPGQLREQVALWFDSYIECLLDEANVELRGFFRRKFAWSFGVAV